MDRNRARALLDRLHAAQNEFYGGGSGATLRELLTPDVEWTVPGVSAIAGHYVGLNEVFDYFGYRRDRADRTFQMRRRDVLVGAEDHAAALTDGSATISGQERHWSTVGLYALRGDLIAACWLLPLDQAEFDAIWA